MHPINLKGLVVFYIFQRLIHIFKDDFTKIQDNSRTKGTFFQIPGVFQDQDQFQGLFQVCANPVTGYGFFKKSLISQSIHKHEC